MVDWRKIWTQKPAIKTGADINWPKIPQMSQKFLPQFVSPSPKVWNFQKKFFLGVRSLCFISRLIDHKIWSHYEKYVRSDIHENFARNGGKNNWRHKQTPSIVTVWGLIKSLKRLQNWKSLTLYTRTFNFHKRNKM